MTLKNVSRVALALLAIVLCVACQGNTRDNAEANEFLILTIQDGEPNILFTDVAEFCQIDALASLDMEHRFVGGGSEEDNTFTDVLVNQLCFSYVNELTGGSTPGVDVPAPFCQNFNLLVPSGGTNMLDNVPVIYPAQKTNPPLNQMAPGEEIPFTLKITAHSHNISGEALQPSSVILTLFAVNNPPSVLCP